MEMGSEVQVLLPMEEFHDDVETRLGRANGNIYHRQEGIEGVHDGQVMVRLKKKRYIIIDYSIIPNEQDYHIAATNPHISIPNGAGKQKCTVPECTKVGVPVCLYDSEPNEPISLYLRSGLCFTCQRNLNEKRRTQRKRQSDGMVQSPVLYAVGPGQKKMKVNGMSIDLASDAIILNGQYGTSTKTTRDGYSFDEIGPDLTAAVHEASTDTHRLVHAISTSTTATTSSSSSSQLPPTSGTTTTTTNGNGNLLSVEEVANVTIEATNGLLAGVVGPVDDDSGHHDSTLHHHHHQQHHHLHHNHHSINSVMNGGGELAANAAAGVVGGGVASSEDINVLYDKAFSSLSRSIFLLTQWKQSWDSAIAAAVAQETLGDPSLADAVASAAAVAAAATDGTDHISLLLAADQRKDDGGDDDDEEDEGEPVDVVVDGTHLHHHSSSHHHLNSHHQQHHNMSTHNNSNHHHHHHHLLMKKEDHHVGMMMGGNIGVGGSSSGIGPGGVGNPGLMMMNGGETSGVEHFEV